MALSSTTKLSEFPSLSIILFSPRKPLSNFKLFFSSSLRTPHQIPPKNHPKASRYPPQNPKSRSSASSSWIHKWPNSEKNHVNCDEAIQKDGIAKPRYVDAGDRGRNAIDRIVLRLRNLGLDEDVGEGQEDKKQGDLPWEGEDKLGDLLQRDWARPDYVFLDDQESRASDLSLLPWERGDHEGEEEEEEKGLKRKRVKAPTLAELTIEDMELKRLRRDGIVLRERISIAKAGVTQAIVETIHKAWRKSELVRLKFHESLTHDMKTAHEIVEGRTGGLVVWRSGSVMVVYRGANYQKPSLKSKSVESTITSPNVPSEEDTLFVPDVSSSNNVALKNDNGAISMPEKTKPSIISPSVESLTEEEKEFNNLLDGFGPRFFDWWGTGFLPVDADLLPQNIPGYKTPFRLLPTGMRCNLTNSEMTSLRKLARSLPCHFALGRNRNHQGLAAAIVKLWEQSTVVKIAIKRGIQNTNNKLMAEELKKLTGGVLLLRNKFYIVIYRGKDFVPTSVAAALTERQELTKGIQDVEERVRSGATGTIPSGGVHEDGQALAGTLAEFHEAQARWGRQISSQEHEEMKEEASRARQTKLVKRVEHKLAIAQAKKLRAERLLAKIEVSMVPAGPCDDQETITDEERFMFRRVGLRMKAYLPLGIRGVFDGVIENMHLHWKHRELVKLISKQKTLSFVEDTARLLEYESGGILVAIERVPKGYALIYYRGKNYQRPISIRPRNLLTKAKALKRSVAMQRHEALSQHISELESKIQHMDSELGSSEHMDNDRWSSKKQAQLGGVSLFTENEDGGGSCLESDDSDEDDEDTFDSEDEDFELHERF